MTNKKNTILFIIAGTIVNVIILLALLLIFIILDAKLFGNNDNGAMVFLIVGIIASWMLGMLIYQKLATWVITKWHLENKLDPLFAARTMKKERFDDQF